MNKLRHLVLVVSLATIALAFVSNLHAQTKSITVSLSGIVTTLPGKNSESDGEAHRSTKRNRPSRLHEPVGEFGFAFLPAGTYTLEASAPGFRTSRQEGITVIRGIH